MSDPLSNALVCAKCGQVMSAEDTQGLCPVCLMSMAMNWTQATQPMTVPLKPPTVEELAPHFPQLEIEELIGRGGMGVVYKARQKSLDRWVALKLLMMDAEKAASFSARFATEARALAALDHPNIVTVYDFGVSGGFYFLMMEFIDGVNLRQAMQASRFSPEQALAIVPPICEALQYAHEQGIVHRDIKPENLLLNKAGRVKIADFGIAKMVGQKADTMGEAGAVQGDGTTMVGGTPQYMAPEQSRLSGADHRADIYSLGVVLYELLTGELPTDRLQLPSHRVQVDVRLDEIVLRALEKSPELRYQTAAEMQTQLATLVFPAKGPAPEVVKPKRVGMLMAVMKSVFLMLMGVVLFMAGMFAISKWTRSSAPSRLVTMTVPLKQPEKRSSAAVPAKVELPIQVALSFHTEGAYERVRSYMPISIQMSELRPSELTKLPEGLVQPSFGLLQLGPRESPVKTCLLVDWSLGEQGRVFFDTNQNGDLTDDPAVKMEPWRQEKNGSYRLSGYGWVNLPYGRHTEKVGLQFHSMPMSKDRPSLPTLIYRLDGCVTGELPLVSGEVVKALLKDGDSDGDFRTKPTLYLDLDGNDRYSFQEENVSTLDAIMIQDVRYEVQNLTASGEGFTWLRSSKAAVVKKKVVAESKGGSTNFPLSQVTPGLPLLESLVVAGNPAPTFTTRAIQGMRIDMPGSYRGKLLLLDFWATWCGPCLREMPHVVAAHRKYRGQGLEVLGISLDQDETLGRLADVMRQYEMSWPQVCEGKSSGSVLSRLYGVTGIPATLLIDGDTGMILATGLRGTELDIKIGQAIAAKAK